MQALLAEKAFILRELDAARITVKHLSHARSGIFIKPESFSPTKLAMLLQDIARARLAELRLSTFMLLIEEKLRGMLSIKPAATVTIGSAPEPGPRRRATLSTGEAFLLMLALRQGVKLS